MKVKNFQEVLSNNRFEFLLFALLLLLFDKIFVPDVNIYTTYIWPFNMIILGFAAVGIFKERFRYIIWIKNVLFILSVLIPLLFFTIVRNPVLVQSAFLVYTFYYTLIFIEVLYQIFRKSEATISVVYGSISGFLLLIVIAQFTFCWLNTTTQILSAGWCRKHSIYLQSVVLFQYGYDGYCGIWRHNTCFWRRTPYNYVFHHCWTILHGGTCRYYYLQIQPSEVEQRIEKLFIIIYKFARFLTFTISFHSLCNVIFILLRLS